MVPRLVWVVMALSLSTMAVLAVVARFSCHQEMEADV